MRPDVQLAREQNVELRCGFKPPRPVLVTAELEVDGGWLSSILRLQAHAQSESSARGAQITPPASQLAKARAIR